MYNFDLVNWHGRNNLVSYHFFKLLVNFLLLSIDQTSAKSLLSTADLWCIQCNVNSWTLDAPKVSCWKQGFGRRLVRTRPSVWMCLIEWKRLLICLADEIPCLARERAPQLSGSWGPQLWHLGMSHSGHECRKSCSLVRCGLWKGSGFGIFGRGFPTFGPYIGLFRQISADKWEPFHQIGLILQSKPDIK